MTSYVVLSKSQKALQDLIEQAEAIVKGEQVTFNGLSASAEKSHLLEQANRFSNLVASGECDKLTIKNAANIFNACYHKTIAGKAKQASSKYEKEVASLRASLLMGTPADVLIQKQDDKENSALYRKNLLLTDKRLQSLINPE
jgi:hypothetical protein